MTTLAQLKEMMETFQKHGLSLTECEKVLHEVPKLLALVETAEEYFSDDVGEFNPKYFSKRAAVQKALKTLKTLHES